MRRSGHRQIFSLERQFRSTKQDAQARCAAACGLVPRRRSYSFGFALRLDPRHPYLTPRGVSADTMARLGLGYCYSGGMKGSICIPIDDVRGSCVAYAWRWANSMVPVDRPRCRSPRGFRKRHVLFNGHRVVAATHLVIVEGFWSVFRPDALGIPTVALKDRTISALMRRCASDRVTLVLDGDAAGRGAIPAILVRFARHRFLRHWIFLKGRRPTARGGRAACCNLDCVCRMSRTIPGLETRPGIFSCDQSRLAARYTAGLDRKGFEFSYRCG